MEKWYSTKVEDFGNVDEETIKRFIGKNADKILEQKFSIPGFLFAPFYAAYRKMFGHSMILLLISLIVALIPNSAITYIINIAIWVAYGFYVNKLYIKHAIKKINKISGKNTGFVDINYACIKKGGTSVGLVFLFLFIAIVVIVITVMIITMVMATKILGDAIKSNVDINFSSDSLEEQNDSENIDSKESSNENAKYEGGFSINNNVNLEEYFTFKMPSQFAEATLNSEYWINYEWEDENSTGIFNECKVEICIPDGFYNAEDLINQIVEYNEIDSEVSTKKSNGTIWYYVREDNSLGTTYHHITDIDGKVLMFNYTIGEDVENKQDAMSYYNDIFASIKFK